MFKRIIVVVLDGVGVGELPDADKFHDLGSNTIANVANAVGGLNLPVLQQLGLGNIISIKGVDVVQNPLANFGKAKEISAGKDSTTGHWEIMGLPTQSPFPTYPNGFPLDIIRKFIEKTGCKGVLGNKAESGTVIINELGEEHLQTKFPIVYTSADSVFQIATHEDVFSVDELYEICKIAREDIFVGKNRVGRVIARPFVGDKNGNFQRTSDRKDFSIDPPGKSVLDFVKNKSMDVIGVGKIEDLFNLQGLTESVHTHHNDEAVETLLNFMKKMREGLIFVNLPDFDTEWGHRNNFRAFAEGLEAFDRKLQSIIDEMQKDDILIITADHGCDPTTSSTDHSREYIPILAFGKNLKKGINLGIRETFADIGATISDYLCIENPKSGKSFLPLILKK
ncbi:MAG: phosphopentomutase [Candidatus Cloacimonadota bacterium]|nr:phosphopentomutase [Candidatus Cloacimonadota bacterium]